MKFTTILTLSASFVMALARPKPPPSTNSTSSQQDTASTPPKNNASSLTQPPANTISPPNNLTNYAMILYPGFEPIDVFGPLNALQTLSRMEQSSLSLLAPTLAPISTVTPAGNPQNSSFGSIRLLPTHTYNNPPPQIDVLLVPGGIGSRDPSITSTVDFIRSTYPRVKYLLTICTGSILAAQAGVLDGKKATTNKAQLGSEEGWEEVVKKGPKVEWQGDARWVVDGNVWTGSGVSAGIDVTIAWIGETHGEGVAKRVAEIMEYTRHEDRDVDPFAVKAGGKTE